MSAEHQHAARTRPPLPPAHAPALRAAAPTIGAQPVTVPGLVQQVISLQRQIGNRAVSRMIAQGSGTSAHGRRPLSLQRKHDDEPCTECAAASSLQEDVQRMVGDAVSQRVQAGISGGQPLDPDIRRKLEPATGMDLSGVSIHAGAEADRLARSVSAEAFTAGSSIFFRHGAYDPRSERGLHLLAHELTHVQQQSAGPVSGVQLSPELSVSDPNDGFEKEAEANADRVIGRMHRGELAPVQASPIQRRSAGAGVLQRKIFKDTEQPGWLVQFNPLASVVQDDGTVFNTQFDNDPDSARIHSADFAIQPNKTGQIIIKSNVTWNRTSGGNNGGGGSLPIPIPPEIQKLCDPCNLIPPFIPAARKAECQELDGRALRKIFVRQIVDDIIRNPCQFIQNSIARTACQVGNIAANFLPFVRDIRSAAQDITNQLNQLDSNLPCQNVPLPTKPKEVANGKGSIEMRLLYKSDEDGKLKFSQPTPISQSGGTGARVVSPPRTTVDGDFGLANATAQIQGTDTAAPANFEQTFGLRFREPAPPPDVPVNDFHTLQPFKVGSDKLEQEDRQVTELHTFWVNLPALHRHEVETGFLPVKITGFASSTGGNKKNLDLSKKRADKGEALFRGFIGTDAKVVKFFMGEEEVKQQGETGSERRADILINGIIPGKRAKGFQQPGTGVDITTQGGQPAQPGEIPGVTGTQEIPSGQAANPVVIPEIEVPVSGPQNGPVEIPEIEIPVSGSQNGPVEIPEIEIPVSGGQTGPEQIPNNGAGQSGGELSGLLGSFRELLGNGFPAEATPGLAGFEEPSSAGESQAVEEETFQSEPVSEGELEPEMSF